MAVVVINGDARQLPLADRSVQCVITSPPYWGLRDYGYLQQIGTQQSPDAYVTSLVAVFAEVHRVLKDDGVVWLNLGDTYQNAKGQAHGVDRKQSARRHGLRPNDVAIPGLKPKDLVGIPWMVAFALRASGWYLRADVIWAKAHEFCLGGVGSAMPLGGKTADRPTTAHEYLFLLTKSRRYYYNELGTQQPGVYAPGTRAAKGSGTRQGNRRAGDDYAVYSGTRRLRDVWFISPRPFRGAHFATFPSALVEPCLLAGSRPGDVVLDPFGGSGTVALVANRYGRSAVVNELSLAYCRIAADRIAGRPIQAVNDKQAGHGRTHAGFNDRYFGKTRRAIATRQPAPEIIEWP